MAGNWNTPVGPGYEVGISKRRDVVIVPGVANNHQGIWLLRLWDHHIADRSIREPRVAVVERSDPPHFVVPGDGVASVVPGDLDLAAGSYREGGHPLLTGAATGLIRVQNDLV